MFQVFDEAMQRPLNAISSLRPPRMDWTIKVRVVKLWNNVSEVIPGRINSTEMVLLDEDVSVLCSFVAFYLITCCVWFMFLLCLSFLW